MLHFHLYLLPAFWEAAESGLEDRGLGWSAGYGIAGQHCRSRDRTGIEGVGHRRTFLSGIGLANDFCIWVVFFPLGSTGFFLIQLVHSSLHIKIESQMISDLQLASICLPEVK